MTKQKAERASIITAGVVIIALTIAAFWLSYAHLASVAQAHGLANSPERRWAWPATLDLFILAGEVLMFRAALRHSTDYWAIGLTVAGSVGSIGLNVAGVGTRAPVLDYVVAAVPPSAALLAFGALMRQVHVFVTEGEPRSLELDSREPELMPEPAAELTVERAETPEPAPDPEAAPIAATPPAPEIAPAVPRALLDHAQKLTDTHREKTGAPLDAEGLRARLGVPLDLANSIAKSLT